MTLDSTIRDVTDESSGTVRTRTHACAGTNTRAHTHAHAHTLTYTCTISQIDELFFLHAPELHMAQRESSAVPH